MDVYWLEQTEADVPAANDWLSTNELLRLNGLRFAKRHADWRLGRWTAKRAVAAFQNLSALPHVLARIEIRPAPSGAPEVFVANRPADATISLSHRSGLAMCAVAPGNLRLGCDLEVIEPHSQAFAADYFAGPEQERIASAPAEERDRLLALLWSGKESALKALREGLRLDTRCAIVNCDVKSVDVNGWSELYVLYSGGSDFHGWWRQADGMLRTLVADPRPGPPIRLEASPYVSDYAAICA